MLKNENTLFKNKIMILNLHFQVRSINHSISKEPRETVNLIDVNITVNHGTAPKKWTVSQRQELGHVTIIPLLSRSGSRVRGGEGGEKHANNTKNKAHPTQHQDIHMYFSEIEGQTRPYCICCVLNSLMNCNCTKCYRASFPTLVMCMTKVIQVSHN